MADNNSLNVNAVTPLVSLKGGTGVSNSFNLTVSGTSSINQNVTTTGSPVFTASTSGNLNLSSNTIISTNSSGNINLIPNTGGLVLINSSVASGLPFGAITQSIVKNGSAGFAGVTYDATTPGDSAQFILGRSRSTTIGSFSALANTDVLGNIAFFGDDGTSFVQCFSQRAGVTGTVSTGIIPTTYSLYTMNSSGSLQAGLQIDNNQVPTFYATIVAPGINTAPPASSSSSLIVGTAYRNTLGYDVVITVYLAISAATTANILLGVGPTSTPTQQTIVSSLTLAALGIVPVTIYLPNNYYALLSTSGTITQTISGQQTLPV